MKVKINSSEFNDILAKLSEHYKLIGPVCKSGEGAFSDTDLVTYAEFTSYEDLVFNQKSYFSPKEHIFPIRETLFYFNENRTSTPESKIQDIILFLRPCDMNGIDRLDTIFLNNGECADFYYERNRERIKFFMIECTQGFDSCFCVSMNSNKSDNYSCAFRFDKDGIYVDVKEQCFESFFQMGNSCDFTIEYIQANNTKVKVPDPTMNNLEQLIEDPVWDEYTSRCIACGRCNTSCITCSCFSMQDVNYDANNNLGERRRVWSGCHVDGYTDMAGGHSFRKKNGDRMRFKTLHKIRDFYRRFNKHMCVGCGRCDDVCPEYISFSKCINKLNQIIQPE